MDNLIQDTRYALRMLIKTRGFTLVAVTTLALGIGVNTAIFSLLNQVLLRTLPVPEPQQLVILQSPGPKTGHVFSDTNDGAESFSFPMYKDLRDQNQVFSGLLARFPTSLNITFQGQTERASGELVSGNYFDVLGVRAVLGRTLTPDDDVTPGAHQVAVLSHRFWARRFSSSPAVLNQTMVVNGQLMEIIGVTEDGFTGVQVGQSPDIFIPITMKAQMTPNWDALADRKDYWLSILGRLAPGTSHEQAQAGLQPLYRGILESEASLQGRLSPQNLELFLNRPVLLADGSQGRQILQSDTRHPLLMLMGMVALVLLITCANLASLLITRGVARQKEIAVRQALGASRWRLVSQFVVESLVLSITGGVVGLFVAMWTLEGLLKWIPPDQGLAGLSPEINQGMMAFNFGLSLVTGLFFGLIPAIKSTRTNLAVALNDQGRSASAGVAHAGLRKGLVVAEIALTMLLLVGAGLFARSLYNLKRIDIGIRTERLIAFSISPKLNGYNPTRSIALFGQLQESLSSLPGVEAASGAELAAFADNSWGSNITLEGYEPTEGEDMHSYRNTITPGYFATLGVPLVAGREFTAQDTAQSQKVAIISESLARKYFGDTNAVGRRMKFGAGNSPLDMEIAGVVKDSKHGNVRDKVQRFTYTPYSQSRAIGEMTFYVRTTQNPESIATTLRQEVARHDASLPVFALRTLSEQIDQSIFADRLLAVLSSAFGLLAALLAVVGIYGVMSYNVTQRTQEMGIRRALGAQTGDILRMVIGQGMWLVGVGIGIGIAASIAATRVMSKVLYGVSPGDWVTLGIVAVLLSVIALIGCYLPARRATKVDPMVALRYE
jgi:predicted permease